MTSGMSSGSAHAGWHEPGPLLNERLECDLGTVVAADRGDRLGELRTDLVAAYRNRQRHRNLAADGYDLAVTAPIRPVAQIGIFDGLAPRQQFDVSPRRQSQRQLLDLVAGKAGCRRRLRQGPRAEQKLAGPSQHPHPAGKFECLAVEKFRSLLQLE